MQMENFAIPVMACKRKEDVERRERDLEKTGETAV